MDATKYTVTIKVEVLSKDAVMGKVMEAMEQFDCHENTAGKLVSDDGDTVEWATDKEEVSF